MDKQIIQKLKENNSESKKTKIQSLQKSIFNREYKKGNYMFLIFRNFETKEIITRKSIDVGAHIPRLHESVTLPNGTTSNVCHVSYNLSEIESELYDSIEVHVQLFKNKK